MAKIKKKGTSGQAKNFITRTQAVRKLQISLPDFRRLCIFKGIYPREPRNKKKASKTGTASTTYYYTKDIQYLLHEPLLNKFRDHKALAKKIKRALGRNEVSDAARLEKKTPRITLDHIIKERYPTFVDALRDLDDALSMLFLFANLPSTSAVPPKTIALCQRLCLEFEHYLITTHSLRKSFLSIKGIYYQATVQGQDILWLVPYKFVQRVTGDVDFRIMGTFVEFYTTLLGFVNFRLYTSIGLVYPPKFSASSDERGGELGAFTLEGRGVGETLQTLESTNGTSGDSAQQSISATAQAEADRIGFLSEPIEEPAQPNPSEAQSDADGDEPTTDAIDTLETAAEGGDVLQQPQLGSSEASTLFTDFTFYLSRETPRQPLEFILKAFGCKRVGWDAVLGDGAFTTSEADPAITHQIVDRPNLPLPAMPEELEVDDADMQDADKATAAAGTLKPGQRVPGRTYIQPQWVWDSINAGRLLRPDIYAPGAMLPPHLSPWVKPKKGEYDPSAPLAEQEREGEAEEAEGLDDEDEEDKVEEGSEGEEVAGVRGDGEARAMEESLLDRAGREVEGGEGMDIAGSSDDDSDDDEEDDAAAEETFGGFDDDAPSADEDEKTRTQHQRELEAEAAGQPFASTDAGSTPAKALKAKGEEARKRAARKQREADEELERQKMMMSRKKRKLFEKMEFSNRKKDAEAEKLRGKKRRIEKERERKVGSA
ncbi:ribosome biogenesis protein Pescadillo [Cryomyces antarcticus]